MKGLVPSTRPLLLINFIIFCVVWLADLVCLFPLAVWKPGLTFIAGFNGKGVIVFTTSVILRWESLESAVLISILAGVVVVVYIGNTWNDLP